MENIAPPRFNSGLLNRGQSFAQLFYKGGKYDYYCTVHPWMIGQVIVSTNSNSTAILQIITTIITKLQYHPHHQY